MEADQDHDGKISFEEFTKMVENTDVSMSMTLGTLPLSFSWMLTPLQATTADYYSCRPILNDRVLTAIPAGRNLPGVLSETWVDRARLREKEQEHIILHSYSVHHHHCRHTTGLVISRKKDDWNMLFSLSILLRLLPHICWHYTNGMLVDNHSQAAQF